MSELTNEQNAYKPSELIGIFSASLARQNEFAKLVYLRGIYQRRQNNPAWSFCYNGLRDETTQDELTLRIAKDLEKDLSDGNLITVGGLLERKIDPRGSVQITLNVTRVEKLQEQAVSEADQRKAELRRRKSQAGFRNVDGVLEQLLLAEQRPKVALLLANNSITMTDFEAGIQAAKAAMDLTEFRADFFKAVPLCEKLREIDAQGFDIIAVVRGGGIGIERLDNEEILETIVGMKTPVVSAVGHPEERLTFKEVADKEVATPTALGQYLGEVVERVAGMKAKSKAVLVEQVRKQFAEQITSLEKRVSEQDKSIKEERVSFQKMMDEKDKAQKEERLSFQKQLDEQAKANREERTALIAQQGKNADELADMRNKVKWMAGKMNEQKKKIVWLTVGLVVMGIALVILGSR